MRTTYQIWLYSHQLQEAMMLRRISLISRRTLFFRSLRSLQIGATGILLSSVRHAYGQAVAPLYTPKEPIPRDPYRSWSLFLINNPQWVVAESNDRVRRLYDQFEAFGRAIGRSHVAVWFWSHNIWQDAFFYKAVDVIRSAEFCQKLGLAPSGGPYILVTTEYPGAGLINDSSTFLPTQLQRSYVLSLNNKSADEIMQLLTRLSDRIVANRLADLDPASEQYWSSWQRTFEGIRDFLSNREMIVTIKTPGVEITVK